MKRIAVLYGGTSPERQVSIKSGKAVIEGLQSIGHDVEGFCLESNSLEGLGIEHFSFVFTTLHGGWGEDGRLQTELERLGVPYSGSDSVACSLAMNKHIAKARFLAARVPTPQHVLASSDDAHKRARRFAKRINAPIVIKPNCQGSSVGVSIVHTLDDINDAVDKALTCGDELLIEEAVLGREFSIPVIGARSYPVVEIATANTFFDYNAKYEDKHTVYNISPDLTGIEIKVAQHYAKRAHDALRCNGYSRVDMMLSESGQFYVLEVNTTPGMTERSLLPLSTSAAQMSFEETLQTIIDASLHPRKTEAQRPSARLRAAIARMAG